MSGARAKERMFIFTAALSLFLLQPPVLRRERVEERLEGDELVERVLLLADLPAEADHAVVQLLDGRGFLHTRRRLQMRPVK